MASRQAEVKIPSVLRDAIAQGRAVAYVGAGFSAVSGMPTWSSLLTRLINAAAERAQGSSNRPPRSDGSVRQARLSEARRAIEERRFTYAASLIRESLPQQELKEIVSESFHRNELSKCTAAQLQRLNFRVENLLIGGYAGIVTTNYDSLIDDGISKLVNRRFRVANGDSKDLGSVIYSAHRGSSFFVKIHGTATQGDLVLSTEEYDAAYLSNPRMRTFLECVMLRHAIVFLGASLEDEIVRIRRRLVLDFDGEVPPAFAFFPESPAIRVRAKWLDQYARIETLFYDSSIPDHGGFDIVLEELRKTAIAKSHQEHGLPPTELVSSLLGLEKKERLAAVGSLNAFIVKHIRSRARRTISHAQLPELAGAETADGQFVGTFEEIVYRVLFLVSVGLLSQERRHEEVVYVAQ